MPSSALFPDWPSSPYTLPRWDGEPVVAFFGGSWWGALVGSPDVVQGPWVGHREGRWADMAAYQDGAPGGKDGPTAIAYSAVWVRIEGLKPRRTKPAARRTWAELSESTKRGYRGPLRRMGLRTEAQFAYYYATAPDLTALRRHQKRTFFVAGGTARVIRGPSQTFIATWRSRPGVAEEDGSE